MVSHNEIADIKFVERKFMPAYTLRGTATWDFLDSLKTKHSAKDIKLKETPLQRKTLEPFTPKGISFDQHVTDRVFDKRSPKFLNGTVEIPSTTNEMIIYT